MRFTKLAGYMDACRADPPVLTQRGCQRRCVPEGGHALRIAAASKAVWSGRIKANRPEIQPGFFFDPRADKSKVAPQVPLQQFQPSALGLRAVFNPRRSKVNSRPSAS